MASTESQQSQASSGSTSNSGKIDFPTDSLLSGGPFETRQTHPTSDCNTLGNRVDSASDGRKSYKWQHICPQLGPLFPETSESLSQMEKYLSSRGFLEASAKRMSGAIQINTTSADGMQSIPGNDPAWDHMRAFSKYLEEAFPLVHQTLELERVNTHGLIYTWQGANESMKPTLLMAHQDVVPVESGTEHLWTYPPFSGHWDGKYVWGRGAIDCKNTLIASLEAVEELLRAGFSPQRTVILSFGFDEEISGNQGAKRIVEHLTTRHGENIAVVIDEGPGIMRSWWGSFAAFPGVAEKGYLDVEISVDMRTGHSSLPPEDNSITVMADLIQELRENRYTTTLNEGNPIMQTIFCVAQHDGGIPDKYWEQIVRVDQGIQSLNEFIGRMTAAHPNIGGFFRTTQSFGMIQGGKKVNVIPGHTSLRINHRIIHSSSTDDVKSHVERIVRNYAKSHSTNEDHIGVNAWGEQQVPSNKSITLKTLPGAFEPSRVSPFSTDGVTPYGILQGTTRAQYLGSDLAFVAPLLMPANTDSRHYSQLSEHIFRFNPGRDLTDNTDDASGTYGAHSINERINMVGHVNAVQWYSLFLRNMDHALID